MPEHGVGAATLSGTIGRRPAKAALATGAALTVLVLVLNVPGNPVAELRDHRVAGTVLSHGGMVLLAVGLWPALSRALLAATALDSRRVAVRLAAVVFGCAGFMLLLAAAWPAYAHQLLTREGVVEPLQFVLYLITAKLCFAMADRRPGRTSRLRLYVLGGWLARLFALEEIDYLGVLSSVMRLAGVERSRIGGSYVGALHDTLNVAAQYGLSWLPLLLLALGVVAAAWWISGGKAAAMRKMLSWRGVPALVGVAFMVVAQFKDVHDPEFVGAHRRLLNDLLEEPLELLAILCLNVTLVLELARVEPLAGRA